MYVTGSQEFAQRSPSNTQRFSSLYDESKHISSELKRMACNTSPTNSKDFDAMLYGYLSLWGRIYNKVANKEIKKYANITDVPESVFRSASPTIANKPMDINGEEATLVSFKKLGVPKDKIYYTVDEINYLKEKNVFNNNKAMTAINSVKKIFDCAWIETDFDNIVMEIQSKEDDDEGKGFHRGNMSFPKKEIPWKLRIPLEELQHYTSRSA